MTNEMVVMYFFDLTSYSLDSIYKSWFEFNLICLKWENFSERYEQVQCFYNELRGGSRAAAKSKMECFVIIVNGFLHIEKVP